MLGIIFPDEPRLKFAQIMRDIKQFANSTDAFDENSFIDAVLLAVKEIRGTPDTLKYHQGQTKGNVLFKRTGTCRLHPKSLMALTKRRSADAQESGALSGAKIRAVVASKLFSFGMSLRQWRGVPSDSSQEPSHAVAIARESRPAAPSSASARACASMATRSIAFWTASASSSGTTDSWRVGAFGRRS